MNIYNCKETLRSDVRCPVERFCGWPPLYFSTVNKIAAFTRLNVFDMSMWRLFVFIIVGTWRQKLRRPFQRCLRSHKITTTSLFSVDTFRWIAREISRRIENGTEFPRPATEKTHVVATNLFVAVIVCVSSRWNILYGLTFK